MQQFLTRSTGWEEAVKERYKEHLAKQLAMLLGFLSVDESDFVKKGNDSVGVARQYCGRLGKTENCQAGVFLSYAAEKGIGLIDSRLYLPKAWFSNDYAKRRRDARREKPELILEMLKMAKGTAIQAKYVLFTVYERISAHVQSSNK